MEKDNGSGYTLTYQEAKVLRDVKKYFENNYLPLWPSEETINNSVENYAKNIKNLKKCVDTAITEWLNPALGLKDPEDKNCNDSPQSLKDLINKYEKDLVKLKEYKISLEETGNQHALETLKNLLFPLENAHQLMLILDGVFQRLLDNQQALLSTSSIFPCPGGTSTSSTANPRAPKP